MAGSWKKMIGIAMKILDAQILNSKTNEITHELLCTFMCEVTAIMNSRPLCPIPTDPKDPSMLTQNDFNADLMRLTFITLKTCSYRS